VGCLMGCNTCTTHACTAAVGVCRSQSNCIDQTALLPTCWNRQLNLHRSHARAGMLRPFCHLPSAEGTKRLNRWSRSLACSAKSLARTRLGLWQQGEPTLKGRC
jgi:hypothetical protein